MQIDPSKSTVANLLAIVASSNDGLTIAPNQVTIGAPTVKVDSGDGRNTSILFTGTNRGFVGTKTVNYTRRPINDSVASPDWAFSGTVGDSAEDIVAALCVTNGLVASEFELTDDGAVLSGPIDDSPATLVFGLKTDSQLYLPDSSQVVTFNWTANKTDLGTAITVTALDGFSAAT